METLISICAWCEPRQEAPAGALITHGICPACSEKLLKPFTGIPMLRPAAIPSTPATMVNGRLRKPLDGIDHLLFGKVNVAGVDRLLSLVKEGT